MSAMSPERWKKINEILDTVSAIAPEKRAEFIAEACGADLVLRKDIEALISAQKEVQAGNFMTSPAFIKSIHFAVH